MNFWAWFQNRKNRLPRRRRGQTRFQLCQALEDRALLAGNVVATFVGGNLTLIGDAANNTVDVTVEGGNVVVRGLDGTTVNGGAANFEVAVGATQIAGNITANLGGGNDALLVTNGLTVGGDISVLDRLGDNRLALDRVTVNRDVKFETGVGADSLSIGNTSVVKRTVWALTREGDDLISIKDSRIEVDLSLHMGKDNDDVVLNNVDILDDAKIYTYYGDDDVSIKDSSIADDLIIKVGRGNDAIRIEASTVGDDSLAMLGRGDDDFETIGTVGFAGDLRVVPTAGDDAIETSAGTTVTGTRTTTGAESAAADTTRLDTPPAGAIPKAQDAIDFVGETTLPLTVSTASNADAEQGNGTLITRNNQFVITGTTRPGATVTVDVSRPGVAVGDFSDGTVVAGLDGTFSITVTLLRDATNNGANVITLRVTESASRTRTETINVHLAEGTIARFATSLGDIEIELLDTDAPETVTNFLNYFARYAGTVFHRSVDSNPGVIQGGGFTVAGGVATAILTDGDIDGEHSDDNPNVRGTLSMAHTGDPDSGTSQWFFNTTNNTALDAPDRLHTVFARVVGDGMNVVDAIQALREVNLSGELTGGGAFGDTPVRDTYVLGGTVTGTVTVAANGTTVTGTGTAFTTELQVGDTIQIGTQTVKVTAIASNTSLTIDRALIAGATAATARFVNSDPANADFVILTAATVLIPRP